MSKKPWNKASIRFILLVSLIIAATFLLNSYIFSRTSLNSYRESMEQISELTAEGIYYRIANVFADPISVSNSMANNIFLKEYLREEEESGEYVEKMSQYLYQYRAAAAYDSVFLVSTATNRYYTFKGIDRILARENEEDVWYYAFLEGTEQYSLNRDNDEAANDEITVFVNSRIMDGDTMLGIVGVGFRIDTLHQLLADYEEEFGVETLLVDAQGIIQVATDVSRELSHAELHPEGDDQTYRVSRYIPELDWYLLVEKDMEPMVQKVQNDISRVIVLFFIIATIMGMLISYMMRYYNRKILGLSQEQERERRDAEALLESQFYYNVHEINITENKAGGAATEQYFQLLGVPEGSSFDQALAIVAKQQLKREYRQGYVQTFGTEHIIEAFREGADQVVYECMLRTKEEKYRWVRLTAHIYQKRTEETIWMYIVREDIDKQKSRELGR